MQQKPPFRRDIERGKVKGFGKLPTRENAAHFTERVPLSYACCGRSKRQMGTHLLCLLPTQHKGKDGKGMERKREIEYNDLLPKKGNPLNEIVTYKVGGTLYEVSTVCGGSELLYDKMKRLIKSETVKTPTDKEKEVRYNEDNNLFVGRSLQEE